MVDAAEQFLAALAGVSDPETKRKIIGHEFIRTFERAQADILREQGVVQGEGADLHAEAKAFLVQGTLYPDVVESGGGEGAANIKSHHNVGGLPEDLNFELVEPLRTLFKDEVRAVGSELGLPEEIVWRQPFPGPGLGIRIIGEITRERLDILRRADAIARAELTAAGLDRDIWQCPVVLLADVRSVGVQGDGRTYGHPIVLRPVTSEDAMTADWAKVPYDVLSRISTRITNEVPEINRVTLDVTSKPPGTIEWECTRRGSDSLPCRADRPAPVPGLLLGLKQVRGAGLGAGVPGLGDLGGLPAHGPVEAVGPGGGVGVDLQAHPHPAPLGRIADRGVQQGLGDAESSRRAVHAQVLQVGPLAGPCGGGHEVGDQAASGPPGAVGLLDLGDPPVVPAGPGDLGQPLDELREGLAVGVEVIGEGLLEHAVDGAHILRDRQA